MGTNYYLYQKTSLPEPDHETELHIGKSSAGWCFALHVIPERGIHDLRDWIALIESLGADARIEDEYGHTLLLYELMEIITIRWRNITVEESFKQGKASGFYEDIDCLEKFLHINNAQLGPNNLLRHQLSKWCIKHGSGTWDCMPGEFS